MAEKKMLIYTCDRCGDEHKRSTRGKQTAPKGWIEVLGRDICNVCVPDLEAWLDNKPVIDLPAPTVVNVVSERPSVWVSQNEDGERVVNVARPQN